jgi:hypothetical protein
MTRTATATLRFRHRFKKCKRKANFRRLLPSRRGAPPLELLPDGSAAPLVQSQTPSPSEAVNGVPPMKVTD